MMIKNDVLISCPKNDSVSVANSFNKIENQIITFNVDNQDYFRSIILNHFNTTINMEYLSGLEIVAEPNFDIDSKILYPTDIDTLHEEIRRPSSTTILQQLITKTKGNSVYPYFEKPTIEKNNVKVIFRLYDKSGKQTDFLEINEYPNSMYLNSKGEWVRSNPLIMRVKLSDTIDPLILGWERVYSVPKNVKVFNINNSLSDFLYRCLLNNNHIYSIECLRRKYPKDKLENILKKPENELCDCDIDNYLKYVKE